MFKFVAMTDDLKIGFFPGAQAEFRGGPETRGEKARNSEGRAGPKPNEKKSKGGDIETRQG